MSPIWRYPHGPFTLMERTNHPQGQRQANSLDKTAIEFMIYLVTGGSYGKYYVIYWTIKYPKYP